MKSKFESSCMFVLASCMVSALGLLMLSSQCSPVAIGITLAGLAGIASGIPGVIRSAMPRIAAKFGKAGGGVPVPI